jgi:hypothetical protein
MLFEHLAVEQQLFLEIGFEASAAKQVEDFVPGSSHRLSMEVG